MLWEIVDLKGACYCNYMKNIDQSISIKHRCSEYHDHNRPFRKTDWWKKVPDAVGPDPKLPFDLPKF